MGFMDEFSDMMADTITITPGYTDEVGDWIASGEVIADVPCYIEGETRTTRRPDGSEVVSHLQVILNDHYNLTTHLHRYTLPTRYSPYANLEVLAIDKVNDEDGPLYEELMFP